MQMAFSTNLTFALGHVALLGLLAGCGSTAPGDTDASGDGGTPSDGGEWTDACITPDGVYVVCNGSNGCFPPDAQGYKSVCPGCLSADPAQPGMCLSQTGVPPDGPAVDGQVYVADVPTANGNWDPYPFEVGVLFAKNGGASQVRYADWRPWTGEALPEPSTCPTFASFRICGGNCGGCKGGEVCTGRSPGHPWGICAQNPMANGCRRAYGDAGWMGCTASEECLVFQSSADGQPVADMHGLCFDVAGCEEAVKDYPGGAFCHAIP